MTGWRSARIPPTVEEAIYTAVTAFLSWVAEFISSRWARRLKKRILRTRLSNDGWEWRSFERLRRAIREDSNTTRELLVELGARASVGQREVWTLERE